MLELYMSLSFDLESGNFEKAGSASSKIKTTLQHIGIPADSIRRIAIATYEGEMNVIIHSQGGTIDAEVYPEYTNIIIKDNGPGIKDVDLALKEGYSTASDEARNLGFGAGMGLPNMKSCSDTFSITSEVSVGTMITMQFKHVR